MSALAEALLTAQRGALAAMQKAYVRGSYETAEQFLSDAERIGCTDKTDLDLLVNALDTLRLFGSDTPATPQEARTGDNEPASDRQVAYIAKLADERGTTAPDYRLTKDQAHKVIDQLKAGTYNPDEWTVPF